MSAHGWVLRALLAGLWLAAGSGARGGEASSSAALLSPGVAERLGVAPEAAAGFLRVAESPAAGFSEEEARAQAPDILALDACHAGGQRVLLRVTFARPPSFRGATFLIYADLDGDPATGRTDEAHRGVDLMIVLSGTQFSLTFHGTAFGPRNTGARVALEGAALHAAVDFPLPAGEGPFPVGLHLLSQREGGRSDSTPHRVVLLPRSTRPVPALPLGKAGSLRPASDWRYARDGVAYEKLADKGLSFEDVAPAAPIAFGRPRPEPPFDPAGRRPDRNGAASRERVPVSLTDDGVPVDRAPAWVTFGFPLPRGALYDPRRMRLLAAGSPVPAQFTATVFWPDDSLRWVLVDAPVPESPEAQRDLAVEFGSEVQPPPPRSLLQVTEEPGRITVTTGPLRAVVGTRAFRLFETAWFDRDGDGTFSDAERVLDPAPGGITLVDEAGKAFTSDGHPPDSVRVELRGPERAVLRIEGPYGAADGGTAMRYIARIAFHADSARVDIAVTHVNDSLRNEFTDLTSLTAALRPAGGVRAAAVRPGEAGSAPVSGLPLRLFQRDDLGGVLAAGGAETPVGRCPGWVRWEADGNSCGAVLHGFWQRWPKGIAVTPEGVVFELLPPQPGPEFGADLPPHLMYCFVEGKYRLKWGMAFTERLTLDLGGGIAAPALLAEAETPLVAVLPAEWYARTEALGPVAAPVGRQFALWDTFVANGFRAHLQTKEQRREYGFLNYGDWFGERGRNWGNNEYDLAHGLFEQFARTGRREFFRWALTAARHQADVDCVHAYPDPYYVGANHQHSIGHTGTWSEAPELATWSYKYDFHTAAAGGHVWADGMVDAWCLAGEPRAAESAIGLGEHIVWAMAPSFTALGTHERSAGWSLRAAMAVYRGTADPACLEAAGRIAAVALREQKYDQGGAWPHVLPADHAGNRPGAVGNNLFLIGILLGGLQAYHEVSGDPAVLRSLEAGAAWVAKTWDEKTCGWPYSATAQGEPLYPPSVSLCQLIIGPLAYVGRVAGNPRLLEIADQAMAATVTRGPPGFGKELAQQLFFAGGTMAELQRWYAASRQDRGAGVLDGSPEMMAAMLVRTASSEAFNVRAPNRKEFAVRLREAEGELLIRRRPHGAMKKAAETATLVVTAADGTTVFRDTCSTDAPHEARCRLSGRPGSQYTLVIDDDQRGVWTASGTGLTVVARTVPGFRIGGVGRSRVYFSVPKGTPEFRVRLLGVHTGPYSAVVLTPAGRIAGQFEGNNPGPALIAGAPAAPAPPPAGHPEEGTLTVNPAAADTGAIWSLILAAAGDIGVELEGVPPFLALAAQDWFDPDRQ